jgi:hypothetical protein
MNKVMKDYRKLLNEIRTEINEKIIAILNKYDCQEIGCYTNYVPVLREDLYDSNLTFTLDTVGVRWGKVYFDGSSSMDNTTIWADNLDIELLVGIYEWLIENEEEIFEEM